MQLYGLKTCDTCRKALKALPHARLLDVRAEGVPENVLAAAEEKFGATMLNTRSTTWRGLDDAEKKLPVLELIKAYPAVMKRPLIVHNGELYLGWSPEVHLALQAD